MMINSSAGLLTVCGRHVALWRRPLPRFLSARINDGAGEEIDNNRITLTREPPAPPVLKAGFQPSAAVDGEVVNKHNQNSFFTTLPELDVAPLLNKTVYGYAANRKQLRGIGMGTSSADTSALRLSSAKKELRETIHHELLDLLDDDKQLKDATTTTATTKKMYIMRRHGVPNQLLQHLVTVADQWLEQKNAMELGVDSTCQHSLSLITTEGSSFRTIVNKEWEHDVSLYLASMKRMVSQLGSMTPFCDGVSILPGDLDWKLTISRTDKLPLALFPSSSPTGGSNSNSSNNSNPVPGQEEVLPVIEWMAPSSAATTTAPTTDSNAASKYFGGGSNNNNNKVGKISIRMQGVPSKPVLPSGVGQDYYFSKESHDVSLIFEASFDIAADEVHEQEN